MHSILYIFLTLSLSTYGQVTPGAIHEDIINVKSEKHIIIPGTRLYIIPPPDFVPGSSFTGFQKGETALINIYDLVGGNFYTNAETFSKTAFENKGAIVFDFKEIKVNGFPGKFIHMQGDPSAKAYAIVFGDTTFSTMIMALYPADDESTGRDILQSLRTVYYDKELVIDPFETANFSIDEDASKFKFFKYSANLYLYTPGGIDNKDDRDAPLVLVSQFPRDFTMTAKSIAEMMIFKAQQYGLTNQELKNTTSDKLNGYETYQTEIYGQLQGKYCLLFYTVVAIADKAIVIQGISKKDNDVNIEEFKKIARSVIIK